MLFVIKLHGLLHQGSVDSFACLSRLKQLLVETQSQESLTRLEEQIGAYDFNDAMLTLTTIAQNIGIDLADR